MPVEIKRARVGVGIGVGEWFAGLALLLAGATAPPAEAGDRKPITEIDLFRFTWGADPQVSADGTRAAFVRVGADKDRDDYDSSVWVVPTSGTGDPRRLTVGSRDSWPRWSPDGSRLLFLRRGESSDGKPRPNQVFTLNLGGGEPRAVTDLPEGAAAPAWSPDGRSIAFLSGTTPEDQTRAANRAKGIALPRESDVRVVTRVEFRGDNMGYRDPKHPIQVWTIPLEADDRPGTPRRLTTGPFDAADPVWTPDGRRIVFVSSRDPEPVYRVDRSALFAVGVEGGSVELVATIPGLVSGASPSPDGSKIAFRGTLNDPPHSYTPPDLFVADLTPGAATRGKPRNLTADYDFDIGGGLTGDAHAPRGAAPTRPAWLDGGKTLVDKVSRQGQANLEAFDAATGQNRPLTTGDRDVSVFATGGAGRVVALIQNATTLPDLFVVDGNGTSAGTAPSEPRRLTDLNARAWSTLDLAPPERIAVRSFDGLEVVAWVQKPPGFDPSRQYPLILDIHGGPHAAYGSTFMHEFHLMAARGYVVLYPNPRGSSSYGAEFGNIIQHRYPGDDYRDLMICVDEVIRRGYVDPKKLGVTGGSGGGLLTNWAITQTDRFAAAVAQRSIADWSAWWYSADFALFQPTWFKSAPFLDPADFAARSPITHVTRINTPLMLIEGEVDLRTPSPAGGEVMFRALKFLRKPTVMVRFPGESHELSRSGKPWHRVERLQHILAWFDKYLQNKPAPQYDLPAEPTP